MEIQIPYLNVINASKAWMRGVMRGVNPRHKAAWAAALAKLNPREKRLVQMVHTLEAYEARQKKGAAVPGPKSKGQGHLRVVK